MLMSTVKTHTPIKPTKPIEPVITATEHKNSAAIEQRDATYIIDAYGDMMYRLAAAQLNNTSDAYDVVQDVMLKIHTKKPKWKDEEHVNAWLIRAVINQCKDYNKNPYNDKAVPLDERYGIDDNHPDYALQEVVANLPEKYRTTLYLYYYEGYKIREIAKILNVGESGIKKRLTKGREMIKSHLD